MGRTVKGKMILPIKQFTKFFVCPSLFQFTGRLTNSSTNFRSFMDNSHPHIIRLIKKFEDKTASHEEMEVLFEYLKDGGSQDEAIRGYLEKRMSEFVPLQEDIDYWQHRFSENKTVEGILPVPQMVSEPAKSVRPNHFFHYFLRYAVAILVTVLTIAYFTVKVDKKNDRSSSGIVQRPIEKPHDIAPGGNKAILTLADGSSIILDTTTEGVLARQAGTMVQKIADGSISYKEGMTVAEASVMNTMSTPRGGQYQLTLVDGTKVWLNAASSITFPTAFTGKDRKVFVTGEVYFEVAKNPSKPFKVEIKDGVELNVIGTHFNINAYSDETSLNTTLIEGALNVNVNERSQRLLPGEQAQVRKTNVRLVKEIDVEQVMAWKNGAFSFKKDNLHAVLRQIARWYDVEVIYDQGVPERVFSGKMGRDLALSQILKFLKDINVNLKLEGKKIIVMK